MGRRQGTGKRGLRLAALVMFIAGLSSCNLTHGVCSDPLYDETLKQRLFVNELKTIINSAQIVDTTAEQYLRDNPQCCTAKAIPITVWDRLAWDDYSLQRYDVHVTMAYRVDQSVMAYRRFGAGNACGRIVDALGESEVVEGTVPRDTCSRSKPGKQASGVIICEPQPKREARSVPISYLRELLKRKVNAVN